MLPRISYYKSAPTLLHRVCLPAVVLQNSAMRIDNVPSSSSPKRTHRRVKRQHSESKIASSSSSNDSKEEALPDLKGGGQREREAFLRRYQSRHLKERKRKVHFDESVAVRDTYSAEQYDRSCIRYITPLSVEEIVAFNFDLEPREVNSSVQVVAQDAQQQQSRLQRELKQLELEREQLRRQLAVALAMCQQERLRSKKRVHTVAVQNRVRVNKARPPSRLYKY
ncbi:MAG: hypothetical protein MHM6MM_005636 [Cercozoa sp. M6MM]